VHRKEVAKPWGGGERRLHDDREGEEGVDGGGERHDVDRERNKIAHGHHTGEHLVAAEPEDGDQHERHCADPEVL
jgi:hypothetical protein